MSHDYYVGMSKEEFKLYQDFISMAIKERHYIGYFDSGSVYYHPLQRDEVVSELSKKAEEQTSKLHQCWYLLTDEQKSKLPFCV